MTNATQVDHGPEVRRPVVSIAPLTLGVEDRPVDLEVRVSAPRGGGPGPPVVVLSHGHGPSNFLSSLHGYGSLADHWAAAGSRSLDHLGELESELAGLLGAGTTLDRGRVAVAGATTALHRTWLALDEGAWPAAREDVVAAGPGFGHLESKE